MTEQLADLIEGDLLPEQVRGQRVAEQVCSFPNRIDASTYQRSPHNRRNCDGVCKTTYRSPMAKENSATSTAWSAEAQIQCDSLANVAWQWHLCSASAFATNRDAAIVPIDIIQVQCNNLAGPQTQSGQQQQNGVVPLSIGSVPLTVIEKPLNCTRWQELRDT